MYRYILVDFLFYFYFTPSPEPFLNFFFTSVPPLDIKYDKSGKIDPEHLLRQSKRGKPLMMFVGMRAGVEQRYTEQVSGRWQQGLQNAHIPVQRYVVAPDRVMFMLQDGSKVWEVKDYLVRQPECSSVNFEQLEFPCATETKGKTEL